MDTFLKLVAADLQRRFSTGMQNVVVVFPGKRARIFLNEYLVQMCGSPTWVPDSRTMQDVFTSLSDYGLIDPIEAVCILYNVYRRHNEADCEPLDTFYGWGQVMLSDFDDIDKHLVNAKSLFSNIEELERLTTDHYLTAEQEATLQQFFTTFSVESNSKLRERFRHLWHIMTAIYDDFNAEMRQRGRLTEGALYRDVVERLQRGEIALPEDTTFAFVGLNALNDVEKRLMHTVATNCHALFYWDYDRLYIDGNHEAGTFMRQNLTEFPNALDGSLFDNIRGCVDKKIDYVATAGLNIQARHIPTWLKSLKDSGMVTDEQTIPDTAIVLCDETLLEPVLHAIPDEQHGGPASANITMGFPMTSTPLYSLVRSLMDLHTNGYDTKTGRLRTYERRIVERNPLIREAVENKEIAVGEHEEGSLWLMNHIKGILEFIAARTPEADHLMAEAMFRAHEVVCRISLLIEDGTLSVAPACLYGIVDQALSATSIPFHGEPAEGLQIMGMLETRCLDFRNILMLSVGEGKMPKGGRTPSFIPYNLRSAFGLTTIEHRIGIEAYYFYRLLQRAERITFVYDTACSEGMKNEMSRFLRQMLTEMRPGASFPDNALTLKANVEIAHPNVLTAKKTPEAIARLSTIRRFSPTALEEYVACPLRYYLHYVGGIKEYEEETDEMESRTFGTIFHGCAEEIYGQWKGRPITADDLNHYIGENAGQQGRRALQAIVNKHVENEFLSQRGIRAEDMNGAITLRRDVIVTYLEKLLRHDARSLERLQCREVVKCEHECQTEITLTTGRKLVVGGIIDRLDRIVDENGVERLQIIDYKTMSRQEKSPKCDMDAVFAQTKKFQSHIFQTFLYSLTCMDAKLPIQPTVFYTQDSSATDYTTDITFNGATLCDFRPYADEFRARLTALLEEIFDTEKDFVQTEDKSKCSYCPFKDICRK